MGSIWWIIFIGLLFYSLVEATTWTLLSFRRGIAVIDYFEPFMDKVPEEIVNRQIELDSISFLFVSQTNGLFRTQPKMSNRRPGFSLLGELELKENGEARVIVRVPSSSVLILITIFIGFIILGVQEPSSIYGIVFLGILTGVFLLLFFLIEKDSLLFGLKKIKKYLHSYGRNT
jgi:hypothetical protein